MDKELVKLARQFVEASELEARVVELRRKKEYISRITELYHVTDGFGEPSIGETMLAIRAKVVSTMIRISILCKKEHCRFDLDDAITLSRIKERFIKIRVEGKLVSSYLRNRTIVRHMYTGLFCPELHRKKVPATYKYIITTDNT